MRYPRLIVLISLVPGFSPALAAAEAAPAKPAAPQHEKQGSSPSRTEPGDHAYLGVRTEPIRPDDEQSGLRVVYVLPGGPAEAMGLQAGDEIIALNDYIINDQKTFVEELRREQVGAKVRFLLRRKGEKVKITGRLGSYRKTLRMIQERARKKRYGKPLESLPAVKWWNAEKRAWEAKEDPLADLAGKLSILFAFDDCSTCTARRYQVFLTMAANYQKAAGARANAPAIAFTGLYESGAQEEAGVLFQRARALFEKHPPAFPVGVVHSPGGRPSPQELEKHQFIHDHGLVVLDRDGKVRYLQTVGVPATEFQQAFAKVYLAAAGPDKTPEPSPPKGDEPPRGDR